MKTIVGTLIGVAICALVFYWLFTSISLDQVTALLEQADIRLVYAFILCSLLTSIFRYLRYQLFLSYDGWSVPGPTLFLIVLVRNFCSDLLPARIGTLIYIFLARSKLGIDFSSGSSSFAFSFVYDFIAIVPIVLFCSLMAFEVLPFDPWLLALFCSALLAASIFAIVAFPKITNFIKRITTRSKHATKLHSYLSELESSFIRLNHGSLHLKAFILSIGIRLGKYTALYVFLLALLLPQGYTTESLPFSKVFIGLVSAELAASLPVSGIAGFGAYQGAWVFTFTMLGYPIELAKLTSVSHHIFTQSWGYGLGVCALLLLLIPIWSKAQRLKTTKSSQ